MFNKAHRGAGFTLIEVLVAIAIMAFVIPSLMNLMIQQTDFAASIREKSIAYWIADNKVAELRVKRMYLNQLLQRESTESVEIAGIEWTVVVDIDQTATGALVLYRVKVGRQEGDPIVTIDAYIDKV